MQAGLRDRTIFALHHPQCAVAASDSAGIGVGANSFRRGVGRGDLGYPGIGTMLYQAIRGSDYYLVQGIVFVVIVSIGLATFYLGHHLPFARSPHHL